MTEENKAEKSARIEQFLDSVDHLSDSVKAVYKIDEETGKYKLDDTIYSAISGTKNTLGKVRAERDIFKSKIDEMNARMEEILSKKENQSSVQMPNDQIDVLKKQIEDLKKINEEKDRASQESTVTSVISSAISKHGAVADATADILRTKVKTVYENGRYVARVTDFAGNIRYAADGESPMTVDELMLEMKNSEGYRPLFQSANISGAGMNRSSGIVPLKAKKRSELTQAEKNRLMMELGDDYFKLQR